MTDEPPLIDMRGVTKDHGGLRPLRIAAFSAVEGDRWILSGLDEAAAETFVHLVSGAAVPDEGSVRVAGVDTQTIATDTDWLLSLDRFGFMTHRAVLLDAIGVAGNLALPMTLSIDPMPPDVRARVEAVADEVELDRGRLDQPVSSLNPLEQARVYLGRALATEPRLLLLEHPTAALIEDGQREAFGRTLRGLADRRGIGWVALSEDALFARASGGSHRRLQPATGTLVRVRSWWPWS